MKRHRGIALIAVITAIIAISPAYAAEFSNGYPSGPHFNLNIHGKKSEFTCPGKAYLLQISGCPGGVCGIYALSQLVEVCPDGYSCDPTTIPVYGNSIFVPENGNGIEIYMQSGKVGGKGTRASSLPQTELWAVDPCAGFDGDGAVIQLPPGEYDVYARALAKPTDNPYMNVSPELIAVEDELGYDLIYLGLVTGTGFQTQSQSFTRTKGKSIAVPITGLFEWSGDVCYFIDPADGSATQTQKCCVDSDFDGHYDTCSDPTDLCSIDLFCKSYTQEWVFNIGDFVNYLWDTENNGLKLLQVRFYPR